MDNDLKRELAELMYDIEVEHTNKSLDGVTDPVFELIRKRGGKVSDGEGYMGDTGFNSKDHNFLAHILEMGLGSKLLEAARKVYGDE